MKSIKLHFWLLKWQKFECQNVVVVDKHRGYIPLSLELIPFGKPAWRLEPGLLLSLNRVAKRSCLKWFNTLNARKSCKLTSIFCNYDLPTWHLADNNSDSRMVPLWFVWAIFFLEVGANFNNQLDLTYPTNHLDPQPTIKAPMHKVVMTQRGYIQVQFLFELSFS